jgi:hypothetical protein
MNNVPSCYVFHVVWPSIGFETRVSPPAYFTTLLFYPRNTKYSLFEADRAPAWRIRNGMNPFIRGYFVKDAQHVVKTILVSTPISCT